MRLTYAQIKALNPCYDPIKFIPVDYEGSLIDILKRTNVPAKDRLWVVVRHTNMTDRQLHLYGLACARIAEQYTTDLRVKECNDTTEAYINGRATLEQLTAAQSVAQSAAESAAWLAQSAAESAAWLAQSAAQSAAESAAWLAQSVAQSAAWLAQSVAQSAARSAESAAELAAWLAQSAARSAESAAELAAWLAQSAAESAEEKQCLVLIKILEEN